MQNNLNLQNLYKLPWSKNNNPIGWIEPTTTANWPVPAATEGLLSQIPSESMKT